jgi:hypothetical protein
MNVTGLFGRRKVLKAAAILSGISALSVKTSATRADGTSATRADGRNKDAGNPSDNSRMAEVPLSSKAKSRWSAAGRLS